MDADKENLLTQNSCRILLNKAKNYFPKCHNIAEYIALAWYIAVFVRVFYVCVGSCAAMFNKWVRLIK